MNGTLRHLNREDLGQISADPSVFLRQLGGPCAIHLEGRDRSRTRAVSTLLHGNEPSGFLATHRWLREARTPAVDTLLVIANVEAALADSGFRYRMLPERRDLNRCFAGPFEDTDGRLARDILEVLGSARPEAVIDVHNNTGHNPPYGVGLEPNREALQLVALFGTRYVWSHLSLGALMEVLPDVPAVTIEVGRSGDPRANEVAHAGLKAFLELDPLFKTGTGEPDVQVLMTPMRVCLRPGARLTVADAVDPEADLTILSDLDRHNFDRIEPGTTIGFVQGDVWPLVLIDEEGRDRATDHFVVEDGVLRTHCPMIPIMITTDPVAAASDCLFYVVHEGPSARPAS